jgi:HTH-type transcriptional regulator/antitoxin HigA
MSDLKYTVIKDDKQYFHYCQVLEKLAFAKDASKHEDEMDLLTLLIKEYDHRDTVFTKSKRDPVMVLKSLMEINNKTQQDIAALLDVSKGYISEVLNYKKRLSSEGIRVLAEHFAIQQEAFNRPYELINQSTNRRKKIASRVRVTVQHKTGRRVIAIPTSQGKTPGQARAIRPEKPSKRDSANHRK